MMSEDGRGGMSDAVAMDAGEAADQLDVEVHSGDGLVARGSVPVADLWTVRPRLLRYSSTLSLAAKLCMRARKSYVRSGAHDTAAQCLPSMAAPEPSIHHN